MRTTVYSRKHRYWQSDLCFQTKFSDLIHHQHKKEHIITRETVIGGDETVIGEEKRTAAETYENTIVPKEDTTTIIALNNTENVSVNGDMSANQTDYALNYY